jgi:hypothetical protein
MSIQRQVQPGLFDRLDTSQQIHRCLLICLASRVGHAGRMLLSSAICRLLCLLLCAQGLCNMSLQPGRYSLVSLTDLTSQQMHRCLLVCLDLVQVMQVPCSCLLSAGCCAVAACTGFVQHVSTVQAARSASPIQHIKQSCWGTLAVVETHTVQMLLFTGCSVLSAAAACTGFVPHVNQTGTSCILLDQTNTGTGICTLACMGTSLSSGCAVAAISVFCCLPVVVVAAACWGVQHAHTAR